MCMTMCIFDCHVFPWELQNTFIKIIKASLSYNIKINKSKDVLGTPLKKLQCLACDTYHSLGKLICITDIFTNMLLMYSL